MASNIFQFTSTALGGLISLYDSAGVLQYTVAIDATGLSFNTPGGALIASISVGGNLTTIANVQANGNLILGTNTNSVISLNGVGDLTNGSGEWIGVVNSGGSITGTDITASGNLAVTGAITGSDILIIGGGTVINAVGLLAGTCQGVAVADSTGPLDVVAQLNALLASLRATGAIAT